MAHMVFAMYASQGTHAEFAERVGAMEFEVEGPLRKGVVRPILSEWKVYDVRLPKKCMQEFANRAEMRSPIPNPESDAQGMWVIRWVIKLLNKFTPLKSIQRDPNFTKLDRLHESWAYKMPIGVIDDPQQKIYHSSDKTREVL